MNFIKKKTYSTIAQIAEMKKLFPQFEYVISGYNMENITFTGTLQPHLNMPEYKVRITYKQDLHPRVKIIYPILVEKPPHFYSKTKTLCLYHPNNFKWEKTKSLAKTIVPWASSWIYYYEVWKEKGIWYGEEADHAFELLNKI